jgi:hypothetical protein
MGFLESHIIFCATDSTSFSLETDRGGVVRSLMPSSAEWAALRKEFEEYRQSHVFAFFETLSDVQRDLLYADLKVIPAHQSICASLLMVSFVC